MSTRLIEEARRIVADRFPQPYHKRAITNGEWDTGNLVQHELEQLRKAKKNDKGTA